MAKRVLPDFERPPVIETVLGIQFQRLSQFCSVHLGAFWRSLGSDWTKVKDAAPLQPQLERFAESEVWGDVAPQQLVLSGTFVQRGQIRNDAEDRMIQVQPDRFHYNWLGHGGGEYPRYARVRPEFDKALSTFEEFLGNEGIGSLAPTQWEVTYVNHLHKGDLWSTPEDWRQMFRPLGCADSGSERVRLEAFGGEWHYVIGEQQGRLHVKLQHGREKAGDARELMVLTLTARGPVASGNGPGLEWGAGLDLGHEAIVEGFKNLTTEEAHDYWGIRHGDANDN